MQLKHKDQMRLAIETGLSLRTVEKWCKGTPVHHLTNEALLRAVSELGLAPENEVPSDEQ